LALLKGHGLEIGAMHNPTPVPEGCHVDYFDVISRAEAMATFPEVPPESFKIDPKYLGDLDAGGLEQIGGETFDFVILNHVIEHVANPIKVVGELFRIVRKEGLVVIACPDKRYTFDQSRKLTGFEHLQREYEAGVADVTDEHYLDFLAGVHPEVMTAPPEVLSQHVAHVRRRREHAHVWDSASFRDFLERSLALLGIGATCVFEATGDQNEFEYFSVWKKGSEPSAPLN
jgi:SAM-dependent methyltransferase